MRQSRRHGQRMALVRRAILGVAAADHQRHDLVAELPARCAPGPSATTSPAISRPGNVGGARRRRIKSLALHDVRPVDAGGGDLHQHLAFGRLRQRPLLRHQHSGPPGGADRDRGHLIGQCRPSGRSLALSARTAFRRLVRAVTTARGRRYFQWLRRRRSDAGIDDEDRPKKKIVHEIGQDLALLSVNGARRSGSRSCGRRSAGWRRPSPASRPRAPPPTSSSRNSCRNRACWQVRAYPTTKFKNLNDLVKLSRSLLVPSIFWTLSGSCPLCLTPPCYNLSRRQRRLFFVRPTQPRRHDCRSSATGRPRPSARSVSARQLCPKVCSTGAGQGSSAARWFMRRWVPARRVSGWWREA